MTNLRDCIQEIIERAPQYVIQSTNPAEAARPIEWEPAAFLAHLQEKSPGVLQDHAWTEWPTHRKTNTRCYIHYGFREGSLGHQGVPGYGRLIVLELSGPPRRADAGESLFGMPANQDGY
jgi:hypothetical protein